MNLFISSIAAAVLASAPAGYKNGSSGSVALSTGQSKGGQGSSGSISLSTGDASGGPAGGISIEVGETVSSFGCEEMYCIFSIILNTWTLSTERKQQCWRVH